MYKYFTLVALVFLITQATAQTPPYKNAALPIKTRVADLLQRMTLEEKCAQTLCVWNDKKDIINTDLTINTAAFAKRFPYGLGNFARVSEYRGWGTASLNAYDNATLYNAIQKYFIENTRLGIPILVHEESLHGNQAKDATAYPTHLALGSSFSTTLIKEVYTAIAQEVYMRGARQVLAPVLDLGRDPRWGRTEETLGEDVYHVSKLAIAEIEAYQGGNNGIIPKNHVLATLKHFGVHGQPESGTNVGPTVADERTLREVYFAPFENVIRATAPQALMPCYAEISGVPSHANKNHLTNLLRKQWGFNGIVVSDYAGITDLVTLHKIAADSQQAALQAITAGIDVELPDNVAFKTLTTLIKNGKLPQHILDTAVARILTVKLNAGLFEQPYVNPQAAKDFVGNAAQRALALKAAEESMVLLKNSTNLLPLNLNTIKKIAVIGPNANRCITGGYTNIPKHCITPLQALQQQLNGKAQIIYAEGTRITDSGDWFTDPVILSSASQNQQRINAAVNAATDADVILLFLGGNEALSREAWSADHPGDLTNLDLMGNQNELVQALTKLQKPMAGFIFSGPPLSFTAVDTLLQSVVQCWYLGQETGTAVTNLILGNINPSGKLPITIPRSVGQLPVYYSVKPSARRNYNQQTTLPLYPFGFGLSYTTFTYTKPVLSANNTSKNKKINVSVQVTNTGTRAGAEVIQLYIRDDVASLTRPIKELKGFEKIFLQPGQTTTVNFTITDAELSFYNAQLQKIVEPGTFTIMVGNASNNTKSTTLTYQ
jgi:beta-glucosidase